MDISSLPKKPGVYRIINKINGFVYYGSAGEQGIFKRLQTHICNLKNKKHHSWILQNDWNKYGENAFKVEIICICNTIESKTTEQKMIDAVGVGIKNKSYNILDKVDRSSLPTETKEKIKQAHRNNNLIICTNKSGYKGVCFYKRKQKWKASISRYNKSYHVGYYDTPEKASQEYQKVNNLNDEDFYKWWNNIYENERKNGRYMWGEKGPGSKISDEQAKEIIKMYKSGQYTHKQLGKKFKMDGSAISNIINGKRHLMEGVNYVGR
jgi:hypothetical protein